MRLFFYFGAILVSTTFMFLTVVVPFLVIVESSYLGVYFFKLQIATLISGLLYFFSFCTYIFKKKIGSVFYFSLPPAVIWLLSNVYFVLGISMKIAFDFQTKINLDHTYYVLSILFGLTILATSTRKRSLFALYSVLLICLMITKLTAELKELQISIYLSFGFALLPLITILIYLKEINERSAHTESGLIDD